jgi:hypothetical protein
MPRPIDDSCKKEWDLADKLAEFLPKSLKIIESNSGYPIVKESGFFKSFHPRVASFYHNDEVLIQRFEFCDQITVAIRKCQEHHKISITIKKYF